MNALASRLATLWTDLAPTPLFGLTLTLVAYHLAYSVYKRSGGRPIANPVAIAVALIASVLIATGTPYRTYFAGAQLIHFLLGPATVALAVPLYNNFGAIRRLAAPMAIALLAGSVVAAGSAVLIVWAFGAPAQIVASIAPNPSCAAPL